MVSGRQYDIKGSYSDSLTRALKPPGWRPEWHVGVRAKSSKKLVAFISAVPALIAVRGKYEMI